MTRTWARSRRGSTATTQLSMVVGRISKGVNYECKERREPPFYFDCLPDFVFLSFLAFEEIRKASGEEMGRCSMGVYNTHRKRI